MSMPIQRVETPPRYNGIIHGLDESLYHAQPELSSTGARTLINDSPARFDYDRRHRRAGNSSFDVGHAAHAKILGVGLEVVTYPDEHLTASGNVSTKAATVAWAEEQREAGRAPVTPEQVADVDRMAEAVLAHDAARRILESDGSPEVSVFAEDPETGIRVRARFDWLGSAAADLKTTAGSASASGFGASAAKFDYPMQQVWYEDVFAWATNGVPVDFKFIVVEKSRPHFVAVHQFDDTVRLIAAEKAARARRLYAECMATDTWPAYGDDVIHTEIPNWWFSQNEEELPDSWT